MTYKEIWDEFCNSIKEQTINAWTGIKQLCSGSFQLVKDACINLVKSIYEWLVTLISGFGKIVLSLINIVITATGKLIISVLKLTVEKIIECINKW